MRICSHIATFLLVTVLFPFLTGIGSMAVVTRVEPWNPWTERMVSFAPQMVGISMGWKTYGTWIFTVINGIFMGYL